MQRSFKCNFVIIISIILFSHSYGQTADSIHLKNQELNKIKKDISALEKQLQTKSKKERESLQALENINQQNLLLNKLVNNLLEEEKEKETAIQQIENEVGMVESRIKNLKEKYSQYIVWLYKNRGLSMWRFILDAESFNQQSNATST